MFNREQAEDDCDTNTSVDDTDQRLLTFSDNKSDVVSGHALWRQQFSTVVWLHMLNMYRERKAFIYTLVFSLKTQETLLQDHEDAVCLTCGLVLSSCPLQPGLVPGVCCRGARPVSGHWEHPDPLTGSSVSSHLPPEEEPVAPEIRHQPPGSELLW